MTKIQYSELPTGLHVAVDKQGRQTVIYLLPGLTRAERRAALTRVRRSSRMGHGPDLPPLSLAVGVGADRLRTTVRTGAAAMRCHPVLLPPLVLVSIGLVFALVTFARQPIPPGTSRPPVVVSGINRDRPGTAGAEDLHAAQSATNQAGATASASRVGASIAFAAAVTGSAPASNPFAVVFRGHHANLHRFAKLSGWPQTSSS